MSKRLTFAALFALVGMAPALATDKETPKKDKPALLLRLAALEHLRGDFRYLAEVVGAAEKAKRFEEQIEEFLTSKLGEKGLRGVDAKKPLGAYGWIGSTGIDSNIVLLLPITDKKAFLALLSDVLEVKPEKGEDEVYTINVENVPFPVYFRFAKGYVYVTVRDKEVLDKDKLLPPAEVLPADWKDALSLTVNIDQIPDNLKEMTLGALENKLADLKEEEASGHTEAEKKFIEAAIDEYGAFLKSLLNHGSEAILRLDLDRKAGDLSLTVSVAGKPDSPLAKRIHDLGQVKSLTASLGQKDAAISGTMNVSLPKKLRPLMASALKDIEKQALAKAKNKSERDLRAVLIETVMPTLRVAELDMAFRLQGPNDKGLYSLVGGAKIKDGAKWESSFRKLLTHDPKVDLQLDIEKVHGVGIHRVTLKKVDANTRRLFGDNPLYLAFRKDLLLFSGGDNGLELLKEALAIGPTKSKVWELQMSLARVAPLFHDSTHGDIARKVFGDDKDGDHIYASMEGGEALTLHLSLKAKLIDYLIRVGKAKKAKEK